MTSTDMDGLDEDFPSWLRRTRDTLFITQEALADAAGLSVRTIRYLEAGRTRPRPHTRHAINTAFARLTAPNAVAGPDGIPAPAQLPLGHGGFVGREPVLHTLDEIVTAAQHRPAVAVVTGGPGIGKTALAVHWAHQARPRFPDGQLFADLQGFNAAAARAEPDELVRGFLEALGTSVERIPRNTTDCYNLYRTMLAGRRVLILLDNAAEAGQVRPLLPTTGGSMAVVTSRHHLTELVAGDGAAPVPIGPCTPAEARALLTARLGAARLATDPQAAAEIVRLCAGMPLALSVVAARAATYPDIALAEVVADLKDSAAVNVTADVQAAMSWSYAALSEPAARMFRILGLHPHPEITAEVMASVDRCGIRTARAALDELADANLLIERRPARFVMHDVIHAYAGDVAGDSVGPATRNAVRRRLHQYYAAVAAAAVALMCPHHPLAGRDHLDGAVLPVLGDARDAVAVLSAEQNVLHDIVRDAAHRDEPDILWRLASSLFIFSDRQGRWRTLPALAQHAGRAAQFGDSRRRLDAERLSALALSRNGDREAARRRLETAIQLAGDAGEVAAVAAFHFDLGILYDAENRHGESAHHFDESLDAYRRAGDPAGEAAALNSTGWARLHLGELGLALDHCRRALVLHGLTGNVHGEASTLDTYALALHRKGDAEQAVDAYRTALELMPAVGDRHLESTILEHLGDACESAGDLVHARAARHQALAILDDINPDAALRLRSRLRQSALEGR
ncbi:NB-ARC domain-containing protein [Actinoplanes sp. Pm04-4]|uniref:NB-ARC domain-containing protein n=1 Tax=Paractinoplanes pyxinae TaxID=2997416 RepID=A0ABT4BEF9_9ACTN|nr:AAA family ATPase [Actinoplanes pyxinae]MCY1144205.1 NB-ARC domain-containing protein [Actinoplanes pyxinae]